MRKLIRPLFLSGLLVVVSFGTGCNPLSLPYFMFAPDPSVDPAIKNIAPEDKKKEVKVAILTYVPLETRPELVRADRELSEYLGSQIREYAKANDMKITVTTTKRVHEFLNQH